MPEIVTLTINPAIDIFVNVDRVEPTRKLRCSPPKRDPGGGGINVARVAHRLGADVTGDLSDRRPDRQIAAAAGRARGHRQPGDAVARRDAREFHRLRRRQPASNTVSCCRARSCTGPNGKPCSTGWRRWPSGRNSSSPAAACRPARRTIFSRAWRGRPRRSAPRSVIDTSGPALAAALDEGVTYHQAEPGRVDANSWRRRSKRDDDRIAACRKLTADGRAEIVALTLGDQGAMLVTAERAWRALPLQIEAVSTVGAGDSFLGGLVAALAGGKPLDEAFRVAVAAASAAVMHAGHRPVPAGGREAAVARGEDQGDRAGAGVTYASPPALSRAHLRALAGRAYRLA